MAGLIPQSFIDDLLNRTDIVEVVGSRISLKKTGKNYSARCPFHNEKTPSFSVSPDKQFYYCFGCGAGGNALGFVMDHDHLDFPQAIEDLARRAGLEVPREERDSQKPRQPTDSPLYPLLAAAAEYFRSALKNHPARQAAVDYLKGRGLSGAIARDFGLGFAPPGWDNLSKHLGGDTLQQQALLDAGLLVENAESGKRYDRFRDRIIFPIRDSRGRVIGFGGRVLGDNKPKYLNSPETAVFHKGQELYGLYEARQASRNLDEIMVVEGYMDVIALAQNGLRNAVATLGTATSEEHIKRLFRLVPNLLFCFDGDAAGRKAAWRALEACLPQLQDGRRARFLFLPEGQDPDSLVRQEGLDAFAARCQHQALALTDYLFNQLHSEVDADSLEGKAHLAMLAAPLIEKIPGAHLRTLLAHRLTQLTGLNSTPSPQPPPLDDAPAPYEEAPPAFTAPHKPSFSPRSKRAASSVETPVLSALRCLLRNPALAQKVTEAEQLAEDDQPQHQLLVALLEALQKKPEQSIWQLIARWHGTDQGHLLKALAEREWLIDEQNLEQQFFDTITKMTARQQERRLELLLHKARQNPLSDDEKAQLRELLQARSRSGDSSQTGV